MTIEEETFEFVTLLIKRLFSAGYGDYEVAKTKLYVHFNNMYNASWENHCDCSEFGLPNITIVHEDHYDNRPSGLSEYDSQDECDDYDLYVDAQYVFVG